MFLRPTPDSKSKDRLGIMKTTFNLKQEPEVSSAFYFDLALRTFLAVKYVIPILKLKCKFNEIHLRSILQVGAWPMNIKYLSCDDYDGSNTPDHAIDLRSYFVEVNEPATYGTFEFGRYPKIPFNGNSYMKFEMDINAVTIRGGASVNTKSLGSWSAGIYNKLKITNEEEIKNLTADIVYRVYTVVVSFPIL